MAKLWGGSFTGFFIGVVWLFLLSGCQTDEFDLGDGVDGGGNTGAGDMDGDTGTDPDTGADTNPDTGADTNSDTGGDQDTISIGTGETVHFSRMNPAGVSVGLGSENIKLISSCKSDNSLFAASDQTLYEYDGVKWQQVAAFLSDAPTSLHDPVVGTYVAAIECVGPDSVYIFLNVTALITKQERGDGEYEYPAIWHWNGSVLTCEYFSDTSPRDVWARAADDMYTVVGNKIKQYDGGDNYQYMPIVLNEETGYFGLKAIWGAHGNAAFAVGAQRITVDDSNAWTEKGIIFKYDGAVWTMVADATFPAFNAVWGTAEDNVYAVADTSIWHYDGVLWQEVNIQTGDDLLTFEGGKAVGGTGPNDVHVVTSHGVLHFDGTAWHTAPGITDGINDLDGSSEAGLVAVGGNGLGIQWDGRSWASDEGFTFGNIVDMWRGLDGSVYLADSDGTVFADNGEGFSLRYSVNHPVHAVYKGPGAVYLAGAKSITACVDVCTPVPLQPQKLPLQPQKQATLAQSAQGHRQTGKLHNFDISGVFGIEGTVFVIGSQGTILKGNATGFVAIHKSPASVDFYGGYAVSPDSAYLIGSDGLYHLEGDQVSYIGTVDENDLRGANIVGFGPADMIVTARGVFYQFDGVNTTRLFNFHTAKLFKMGTNDLFAISNSVGKQSLLHYDGVEWIESPIVGTLQRGKGLWGDSPDQLYMMGTYGFLAKQLPHVGDL